VVERVGEVMAEIRAQVGWWGLEALCRPPRRRGMPSAVRKAIVEQLAGR
jgi:hypothetical protein